MHNPLPLDYWAARAIAGATELRAIRAAKPRLAKDQATQELDIRATHEYLEWIKMKGRISEAAT